MAYAIKANLFVRAHVAQLVGGKYQTYGRTWLRSELREELQHTGQSVICWTDDEGEHTLGVPEAVAEALMLAP